MDIETKFANTLTERPIGFRIKDRHFFLYPATLGRMQIESEVRKVLQPNPDNLRINADIEIARMIAEHTDEALWAIAYATAKGKECMDNDKMAARVKFFRKHAKAEDIATLFVTIISEGNVADLQKHYGISRETEEYRRICDAKDTKGTYIYGGRTIYGALIAPLMEKYGWTLDYILWGISYANIQMLMADATKTVTLNKEEERRIRPRNTKGSIRVDDPRNLEYIKTLKFD
jgi:hypothetical protein